MIFRNQLYRLLQQLRENRTLLAPHSHQSPHLMHQISPKAKMRFKFMILCQPSLNDIPFIFPSPLLYKPLLSFILEHKKKKKKPISSLLWSSSEVEQSCHILIFLKLKVLSETHSSSLNSSFPPPLGLPSRVSSSTIWILHEGIIYFPNYSLCCHDESL